MLTVITAAGSKRLATVAALRDDLKSPAELTDALAGRLLDQASGAISSFCCRDFPIEVVEEVFTSACAVSPGLRLQRLPVVVIASVMVEGEVLNPAEYEVSTHTGRLFRVAGQCRLPYWPPGRTIVRYTGGYVLPDAPDATLPADVERAALDVATAYWDARGRSSLIRSESTEGIDSISYVDPKPGSGGLPLATAEALRPFISWWA